MKSNSFFLFGARATGKTSLLKSEFSKDAIWIDLLEPETELAFLESPGRLSEVISAELRAAGRESGQSLPWVVIDEVQKVPKLLDQVHYEIEKRGIRFALTGSSARRLKKGGANLLAGRAFVNHLFPLTYLELQEEFQLSDILRWGSLPKIFSFSQDIEREEYLKTYAQVYLKEEILQEQLVRSTTPFRKFLGIAAQMNGKIINYKSIADDLGVDWTTVKNYYEILEDTWLGFQLPAYERSLRKQQLKASKFFLFDLGVQRALEGTLKIPLLTGQQIGPAFEHFLIVEMFRLNSYLRKDFKFSYLATQGGLEIDLIIERPGQKTVCVEIKSAKTIRDSHLKHLRGIKADYDDFEYFCLCQESQPRDIGEIFIRPWQMGLEELGFA